MSDILELANSIRESTEEIRQAIINKGVAVDNSVKFADYAKKIGAIKKASDYSVTEVDAINYSGKEVVAGDKIWVVPQNVSEDGEAETITGNNNYAIVSRDGTTIYINEQKYDIATKTYTPLTTVSTYSKPMLRWGSKDIYIMDGSNSASVIASRGSSVYSWLYDDLYLSSSGEVFYKGEKIGETAQVYSSYHACFDHKNNLLYLFKCYNGDNIARYKIDTAAKSVEEDSGFSAGLNRDTSRALIGTTGDGKYLILGYESNACLKKLHIAKISDTGLLEITDFSELCEDLAGIYDNPNATIQFNGVDDILLLRYNGFQWVFKYADDKFVLTAKITDLGAYQYQGEMSCSADGKVICGSNSFKALQNVDNTYKAISFTAGGVTSDGFSGVAKGSAGSGETFKVGVVLPPVG